VEVWRAVLDEVAEESEGSLAVLALDEETIERGKELLGIGR
jgi:hypothetical protein